MKTIRFIIVIMLIALLSMAFVKEARGAESAADSSSGQAQEKETSADELAKKSQNPVGDLITVPFQYNINFDSGPYKRTFNNLNIQPVIPMKISDKWNMINRLIVPISSIPIGKHDRKDGFGDITYTAFFSPRKESKLIWGAGPVFMIPTASDETLGSGKWGTGPSVVALTMKGPWVTGAITSNIWSVGGDPSRESINQFLIQPFVNYNMPKGWYFSFSPIITANWNKTGKDRWTVPLGAGVGKVFSIGHQPLNVSVGAYKNVVKPNNAPDWQLRFQINFLFPQK